MIFKIDVSLKIFRVNEHFLSRKPLYYFIWLDKPYEIINHPYKIFPYNETSINQLVFIQPLVSALQVPVYDS